MQLDLSSLIQAVKAAKEVASYAESQAAVERDAHRRRQLQSLIDALRQLYFSPRGVLKLIKDLAAGVSPTDDQVAMILPPFNDYEFRVVSMRHLIDPPNGEIPGKLSLRLERALREISNEKLNIRRRVQDLLNESLTLGRPIGKTEALKLQSEIVSLNEAIEAAEVALISVRG